MCTRVTCSGCGKPDWSGCGAHVDQVMRGIPAEDRCKCREDGTRPKPKGFGELISGMFGFASK